jgi:hypothetical protein
MFFRPRCFFEHLATIVLLRHTIVHTVLPRRGAGIAPLSGWRKDASLQLTLAESLCFYVRTYPY